LEESLLSPMNSEDSVKASPTDSLASLAPPKSRVISPPTSLPKSRVTEDPLPVSWVDPPLSKAEALLTVPLVPYTDTGATVWPLGARMSAAQGFVYVVAGFAVRSWRNWRPPRRGRGWRSGRRWRRPG
jgi:hypothetical protein